MRLAFEWGIPPRELGRRLTSADVTEILAYLSLRDEAERQAREAAKLNERMRRRPGGTR